LERERDFDDLICLTSALISCVMDPIQRILAPDDRLFWA
jgi:hypothetical protein